MIVIIVICIIILLTLLNKNEQFVNYKPVTVTPKNKDEKEHLCITNAIRFRNLSF